MSDEINLDSPTLTVQETMVTYIGDYRVGCGNVLYRDFKDDNGEMTKTLSIRLSAETGDEFVLREGDEFVLDQQKWRVLEIREKSEERAKGEAVLEQMI